MPQYLLAVHTDYDQPVDEAEMQARFASVDEFNQRIQASGVWVFGGGLHPPTTATVVRSADGRVSTTDGPYLETKEVLGGFWIIEAPDLDEALAVAAEGSEACGGAVEVRPFQDEA